MPILKKQMLLSSCYLWVLLSVAASLLVLAICESYNCHVLTVTQIARCPTVLHMSLSPLSTIAIYSLYKPAHSALSARQSVLPTYSKGV